MKKTIIALTVAGLSFNAAAADLTQTSLKAGVTGTSGFPLIAKEVVIPAAGLEVTGDTTAGATTFDTTVAFGSDVAVSTKRYARFELTNAKFKTVPATTDLTLTGAAATSAKKALTSFSPNNTYVVFEVETDATDVIVATDKLTLALTKLVLTNGQDATIKYSLYTDSTKATDGTNGVGDVLASKSGPIASFDNALVVTAKQAGGTLKISKDARYEKFVGDSLASPVIDFAVAIKDKDANANEIKFAKVADATADLLVGDLIQGDTATPSKLTVTGDFTARNITADALANFTLLSATAGKLEYKFKGTTTTADTFSFVAKANTAIPASAYSLALNLVPAAATIKLPNDGVFNFADVAKLERDGLSGELDLVFSPETSYPQFVRISNVEDLTSTIRVIVYNDAGESATFPLSSVPGQTGVLAPFASTTQLSTKAIFDAAQVAKPSFNVVNDKKMRIEVIGSGEQALSVQSYVVSRDGQNLGQF